MDNDIIKENFMRSKSSEPWFDERLVSITGQENWCKQDEIIYNQTNRQKDKHYFFYQAFELIEENSIEGDYHEFGCHKCRTFRMALLEASKHFLQNKMKFYAYDSFQGLPKVEQDHQFGSKWDEGSLCTTKERFIELILNSGFEYKNIEIIEGFYNESLPKINKEKFYSGKKASFINIDCDLYESAVPVFKHISDLIQEGTVLFIDDYFTGYKGNPNKGVSGAMREWLKSSDWEFESYRDVSFSGKSFIAYKK